MLRVLYPVVISVVFRDWIGSHMQGEGIQMRHIYAQHPVTRKDQLTQGFGS